MALNESNWVQVAVIVGVSAGGTIVPGVPHTRDLAIYRGTGAVIGLPYMMSLLAATLGRLERPGEGLSLLDDALAVVEKMEHRTWEAELHRLQGELLWSQGAAESEVEVCFQRAIEIAHQQRARSLELRAVTSLSRLWQAQDKTEAAYQRLAEVYYGFSEGLETLDLIEARELQVSLAENLSLESYDLAGRFSPTLEADSSALSSARLPRPR